MRALAANRSEAPDEEPPQETWVQQRKASLLGISSHFAGQLALLESTRAYEASVSLSGPCSTQGWSSRGTPRSPRELQLPAISGYEKRRLEDEKRVGMLMVSPLPVKVSGAGTTEVNGTYSCRGTRSGGIPYYHNDHSPRYALRRVEYGFCGAMPLPGSPLFGRVPLPIGVTYHASWWLCDTDTDTIVYRCDSTADSPDQQGWYIWGDEGGFEDGCDVGLLMAPMVTKLPARKPKLAATTRRLLASGAARAEQARQAACAQPVLEADKVRMAAGRHREETSGRRDAAAAANLVQSGSALYAGELQSLRKDTERVAALAARAVPTEVSTRFSSPPAQARYAFTGKKKLNTNPAAKPIVGDPNAVYQGCSAHGVIRCRLCRTVDPW